MPLKWLIQSKRLQIGLLSLTLIIYLNECVFFPDKIQFLTQLSKRKHFYTKTIVNCITNEFTTT